jgi:hypothetical protein
MQFLNNKTLEGKMKAFKETIAQTLEPLGTNTKTGISDIKGTKQKNMEQILFAQIKRVS